MKVSTPKAAALDLFGYPNLARRLSNIAIVLAELAEKIDPQKLTATARLEDDPPSAQ